GEFGFRHPGVLPRPPVTGKLSRVVIANQLDSIDQPESDVDRGLSARQIAEMGPGGYTALLACFSEDSCHHEIALISSLKRPSKRLEGFDNSSNAQQNNVSLLPVSSFLTYKYGMTWRGDRIEFAGELLPVLRKVADEEVQHIQVLPSHLQVRLGLRQEMDMCVTAEIAQFPHIDPPPQAESQGLASALGHIDLSLEGEGFETAPQLDHQTTRA